MTGTPHIRIIGDVHNRLAPPPRRKQRNVRDLFPESPQQARAFRARNYLELIQPARHSVQVGDLAIDYSPLVEVDHESHRAIAGNHDNLANTSPQFLGDFGVHSFPLESGVFQFFYLRGARSLDIKSREEGVNWWPNEELSEKESALAIELYRKTHPSIVITHDCPTQLVSQVATTKVDVEPSRTNRTLQACLDHHQPELWMFGHYHRNWVIDHECGTKFVCLGELGYYDLDERGTPLFNRPR